MYFVTSVKKLFILIKHLAGSSVVSNSATLSISCLTLVQVLTIQDSNNIVTAMMSIPSHYMISASDYVPSSKPYLVMNLFQK